MKREAFTLIELLVVVAIIALLMAILLPVFETAQERGRMSSCASNEKQIGIAVMQYSQDYDEMMPAPLACPPGPSDWVALTAPYLKSILVWHCPDFTPTMDAYGMFNTPASYSWNGSASCSNQAPALAKCSNPALTFLLMDKGITYFMSSNWDWCDRVEASIDDQANVVNGIHLGGKNVMFADFHVKWLATSQIHAKDVTAGTSTASNACKAIPGTTNTGDPNSPYYSYYLN